MENFDYRAVRKNVRTVAGLDRKGQAVFRAGSVPVLMNYSGQTLTSVTVLSDASARGRAVARVTGETATIVE